MIQTIKILTGATLLTIALSSCYKNEYGVVDLTMPEDNITEQKYVYIIRVQCIISRLYPRKDNAG